MFFLYIISFVLSENIASKFCFFNCCINSQFVDMQFYVIN